MAATPGPPHVVVGRRYELDRLLGCGNFGEVWLAHDLTQDDVVAVKLYGPAVTLQDVLLEGRILTRLREHPNVVNVRNVLIEPPRPFMAMDYVRAGSVAARLGPLGVPLLDAHRWTRNALQGLAHVHALGILHRDMKPANLLVADNGEAVISDFGLSEDTVTGLAANGIYGPHIAPEQLQGAPSTVQTDIWATGCTLYRLVTGAHPFGSPVDLAAVATGMLIARPHNANPQVPLRISRLIDRALAVDPAVRFRDANEMLAALNRCAVHCSWEPVNDPAALQAFDTVTQRGRYELRCQQGPRGSYEVVLRLDIGSGPRARQRHRLPSGSSR